VHDPLPCVCCRQNLAQHMRGAVAQQHTLVWRPSLIETMTTTTMLTTTTTTTTKTAETSLHVEGTSSLSSSFCYMLLRRFMSSGAVQQRIESKLTSTFSPVHLSVINESFKHNVPRGAETHFNVTVVTSKFDGVPLIERHRQVNAALADELASGVHALAIAAKTPEQWSKSQQTPLTTPNCLGGSKH
jgi:stress-induced morphogen